MTSENTLEFPHGPDLNSTSENVNYIIGAAFNFLNSSPDFFNSSDQPERRYISSVGQIFITGIYVFGAVVNVCSLVLLSQGETARNRKLTLMIRCLTANDLMALCTSFFLLYMKLYLHPSLVASRWYCGLRVLTRFFGFSSGSVASVMAVERFIALTRPFFYQKHITHKVVKRAIFVQWFLVMFIVLLPLAGFGVYYHLDVQTGAYICSRYRQATEPLDIGYAYLMFGFGTTMCIVIVTCNLAVVGALCRISPESSHVRRTTVSKDHRELSFNHTTQEELSFAKLMVILCIFFVVCWLPQMATVIISQLHPDMTNHPFFRIADVCTALNFILDPIVYVLSRRPHRRGLRRLLKPICHQCWPQQEISSCTTSNSQGTKGKELCLIPPLPESNLTKFESPASTLKSLEAARR
ncbi:prostaglandin E2 receptor EP3 subtype-like [Parasteatoda tepidariorum]|uniref:prostaglandin E2 receptor EP3 subtype-like n=1 Tax=Parasteatoda tepidariorum TaxID=114398 RepID=UPI001C71D854|nr:prostacyclin receptor-like [Parasteatoda tepidariorum]